MPGSQFASSLSTESDWQNATAEVCRQIGEQLTSPANLAFVFISQQHAENAAGIARKIQAATSCHALIGCTGESIIGRSQEVEQGPAISLWTACLPEVESIPMHLTYDKTADGGSILGWPDATMEPWPAGSMFFLLADPFSFPTDALISQLNSKEAGIPIVGGNASGGQAPEENRLLAGDQVVTEGAAAILLRGNTGIRTLVSQGCRPVGEHLVITRSEGNVIYELGGKPALLQLKQIFDTLPTHEQSLIQHGLHVGRVVSEYQDQFEQGDFLVRNVLGIDPDKGSIAVADFLRPGQTIQFQIRDQHTADVELNQLLQKLQGDENFTAGGGLLFSCNGRGTQLFSEPHHDASAVNQALGPIPLAGFFAAGEIGPVGKENFVHGFTASLALFPA
jgi:small ligand-binding sensory domain FIST